MREILFRGKLVTDNRWVYGQYCFYHNDHYILEKSGLFRLVYQNSISEFTALTDKNGTKIFEGDIVKDEYLLGDVKYATAQSGFDGMAGFMVDDIYDGLQNYDGFWHKVEVIGNIHDNPELLKENK